MRIEELITILQDIASEHGDVEVLIESATVGDTGDITDAEFEPAGRIAYIQGEM